MEREYYEMNIENWANSIIELEDNYSHSDEPISEHSMPFNSSALVSTMPTYYRSRAFSSHIGINNLINACDPIITLVTKLRRITIPPDTEMLYQNLCHEIKAFENKAQTLGYRSQLILASRYVICMLLDELITLTLWPDPESKKFSFTETFHKNMGEGDTFFKILDRSLLDPAGHIDLLELIYISLRLGFEGKYRGVERGHLELRNITDHLYNVINQYRDEFSRTLHIAVEQPTYFRMQKKNYFHLLPPAWMISTVMILSLLTIFIFLYLKMIEIATPVNEFINTLQMQELTEL